MADRMVGEMVVQRVESLADKKVVLMAVGLVVLMVYSWAGYLGR